MEGKLLSAIDSFLLCSLYHSLHSLTSSSVLYRPPNIWNASVLRRPCKKIKNSVTRVATGSGRRKPVVQSLKPVKKSNF